MGSTAWIIYFGACVACLGSLFMLSRTWRPRVLIYLLLAVLAAVLLVPAEVPNFEEHRAPAFIVALFEAAFQSEGDPSAAVQALSIGLVSAIALVLAGWFLRGRRRSDADPPQETPGAASEEEG